MAEPASAALPHMPAEHAADPGRRDFLTLVTGAFAGLGAVALGWTFVDSMNPSADVLAAGAPIDLDISKMDEGQQIVVLWRGKPILVVRRTADSLKSLKSQEVVSLLSDPNSTVDQQPEYAKNWHRSIQPEYAVLVGICTHLGCLPEFKPNPNATDPVPNWPGGYFCPCHGSKYDLAGRVWKDVPAPYNLPVPPYHFPAKGTLRIGENPTGSSFDLDSVLQM